ncbi:MAG: ATP-binding protein [Bacteroidales bacterium]
MILLAVILFIIELIIAVYLFIQHKSRQHDVIKMETEAKEYKLLLQNVFHNLLVGIYIKSAQDDFRYLYMNEMAAEFFVTPINQIQGKNDFNVISKFNITSQQMREEDEATLHSDTPLVFEREIFNDSGIPVRWVSIHKKRVSFLGKETMILATIIENTAVKQRELKLNNFTRDITLAVNASKMSIWSYDINTSAFALIHGTSKHLKGTRLGDILQMVHPDDIAKVNGLIDKFRAGQIEEAMETYRIRDTEADADESYIYRYKQIRMAAYRSPFTGKLEQIISAELDITNYIEGVRLLEEYKFKMDILIKAGEYTVWEYDLPTNLFIIPESNETYECNETAIEKYMKLVRPDYEQQVRNYFHLMQSAHDGILKAHYYMMWKDGDYHWISTFIIPFKRDAQGGVIRYAGLVKDNNEWKQLTERLTLLKDKAEESNRLKSAFLANMNHEIRTPLNAIVGFSTLMADTQAKEERQEYVRHIQHNNDLLLRLVGDVLDISKLESGKMDFVFSEFDMNDIFEHQYETFLHSIPIGVVFMKEIPDSGLILRSDRYRISQVLNNLISNACKFTEKGCITIGYILHNNKLFTTAPVSITGLSVIIYVKDTGCGISQDHFTSIFNRFSKVNDFEQGAGLGLSLCKGIVDSLGGKIWLESEPGIGSTFYFSVPFSGK